MTDERWLRDALRAATANQPAAGQARASGALHRAALRRKQRLAMASFSAVLAVFVASTVTGGGSGTTGLQPVATPSEAVSPTPHETPEESPTASPTPSATPTPEPTVQPTAAPVPPSPAVTPITREPIDVDVYFLVDQTGSMQPFRVAEAAEAIVERMRAKGDRVRYGYGLFRDYQPHVEVNMPVYQRVARIGSAPRWTGSTGSGGDNPEAHTVGLMASLGWTDGLHVREPAPAEFRAGVARLIVVITDAPMKSGSDYPTIEETIAELNEHGVAAASVVLSGDYSADAKPDLRTIAAETGAVARGSVDCDGDGRITRGYDLRDGQPFVCERSMTQRGGWADLADGLLAMARRAIEPS